MSVTLNPESEQFVREQVARGTYASERDVIEEGLRRLRGDVILGTYSHSELNSLMEAGERDLDADNVVEFDRDELERIKAEGREMLKQRRTSGAR